MRVHLSTLTFDLAGAVAIDCNADSTLGETRRRMNRVATLDGGAAYNDFGYSESDRTIRLMWAIRSAAQEARVARLVRLYSRLRLATEQGVWIVAPESYSTTAERATLSLLAVEKITED